MSWYASTGPVPAEKMEEAIRQLELPRQEGFEYSVETIRAFYTAKEAALTLFKSETVGNEGDYAVSVSGHSTEGFHNVDGHTPNSIVVDVHQVYHP